MKAILTKDVKGLGKARDVVDVKQGYYQNFLLKNQLAVPYDDENKAALEQVLEEERIAAENLKKEAQAVGAQLNGKTVRLTLKTGAGGRLYGAITSKDIADAIKEQLGFEVDKRKVESASIKEIGTYDVTVKLHPTVSVKIKAQIIGK